VFWFWVDADIGGDPDVGANVDACANSKMLDNHSDLKVAAVAPPF
jgi:hypothetical protein